MSDLIREYLNELRASLRLVPEETDVIVDEAEDHLRETTAAGLAAGMTEREAQQAAISAFGSVAAVVRAHREHHEWNVALAGNLVMAAWKLAGLFLLAVGASGVADIAAGQAASRSLRPRCQRRGRGDQSADQHGAGREGS